MILTEANLAEMLRSYRTQWLFVEAHENDGTCPRTTALYRKLRSAGVAEQSLGGGTFRLSKPPSLALVTIRKSDCSAKRLCELVSEVMPKGTRTARTILAPNLEVARSVYQILLDAAWRHGFKPREGETTVTGQTVAPLVDDLEGETILEWEAWLDNSSHVSAAACTPWEAVAKLAAAIESERGATR